MTNDQYIAALKKALSGLDSASRADIIQEIQSHSAETGASLLARFGRPEALAEQYLEGETIKKPLTKQAAGVGKKMFIGVGILASTMLIALALFIWTASSDDFNYANETAEALDSNSTDWVTKPWTEGVVIDVEQSATVFYWHDDSSVRWQCNGSKLPTIEADKLTIRQSRCLVMLPKVALKIMTDQAQIVLVRPQASIDISLKQTSLRIAENKTQYHYVVNETRSSFTGLRSFDDAEHTIKIDSVESMTSPYEQD